MAVADKLGELRGIMHELADIIQKTESQEESDRIFNHIEQMDKYIADKIWDEFVDWDKVSWIPEEEKKELVINDRRKT